MFRVTVAVWVLPPPVPVTVKVNVPDGAPSRTEIPIVDDPEPGAAIEVGLKVTFTSLGTPDADKAMAESKPLPPLVVIVELPEPPQLSLSELGDATRVKSPLPAPPPPPPVVVTVKVTVVVCVTPPPVPVTVIG
jgi:hypothetical protein